MNKKLLNKIETLLSCEYAKDLKHCSAVELHETLTKIALEKAAEKWEQSKRERLTERTAYYLSAEFLIGRSIFMNLYNLDLLEDVEEILKEKGVEIQMLEEIEDAALGNGGLGRLAACFLESAASIDIPLNGYGIRYRYGLFKQSFENGFQKEECSEWLKHGDPWEKKHEDEAVTVEYANLKVKAVPYDMPVIGYHGVRVNNLRLWQSEPMRESDFKSFNDMQYLDFMQEADRAKMISYVLYPNDETEEGKKLRLMQEYFFSSASIQDIVRSYKKTYGTDFSRFAEKNAVQLNDTHPVISILELIRVLEKEGLSFEEAFKICGKVFSFTNHTIMAEALEKWSMKIVEELLPSIAEIAMRVQKRVEEDDRLSEAHFIVTGKRVKDKDTRKLDMANLAIYASHTTNGVAKIHSEIIQEDIFNHWYKIFPERFQNKTNGITPRRWLQYANREMSRLIEKYIGSGWTKQLGEIKALEKYACDPKFITAFQEVKGIQKRRLAEFIERNEGVKLPPDFIFDIQIKRMHEYKRQLLNALSILHFYFEIKSGNLKNFKPTAFIFGAKSAPGYYNAKAIIKLINEIARLVNHDPEVSRSMRVVFVTEYNVSYAEKLVTAADISEQISMAGMEASGTGNMKFMLNGTVTLGTLDGANVEIAQEAGEENNYIFGATVEEVKSIKKDYDPKKIYAQNAALRRCIDAMTDGTLDDSGTGMFEKLKDSLLAGTEPDRYLVLYDFDAYVKRKLDANADFGSADFYKKCIVNMANAGKFSSDRAMREYAKEIWDL